MKTSLCSDDYVGVICTAERQDDLCALDRSVCYC